MLFDTHLHLIYRDQLNYPWLAENPVLNHDATYADYHKTARRIGITGALHRVSGASCTSSLTNSPRPRCSATTSKRSAVLA